MSIRDLADGSVILEPRAGAKGPPDAIRVYSHSIVSYDTSTASAVLTEGYLVELVASTACHIAFGAAATTSSVYLPAGVVRRFVITPGVYIAAVKASGGSAGILSIVVDG